MPRITIQPTDCTMQLLVVCVLYDYDKRHDRYGTEHRLGECDDNTFKLHVNKKCKYNNRDDNLFVTVTQRRAYMSHESRDFATEEQPREDNDTGGTSTIPAATPLCY